MIYLGAARSNPSRRFHDNIALPAVYPSFQTMKIQSFLLSAALLAIGVASAAESVPLFDGKTLAGWKQNNGTAKYEVIDGTIVGTTAEGSPNSFLSTEKLYGDFELEFDVKVDDALNSGVMIRSQTKDGKPDGRVNGPQVEIEASGEKGAEAGYVYGEAIGGWMTPKERLIPHKKIKDGEWNHYKIVAKGPRIQVWINGEPVEDLTDDKVFASHPKGFISLQVHSIKKGTGPFKVAWKNIKLKEL
jgi:hypothetical protein